MAEPSWRRRSNIFGRKLRAGEPALAMFVTIPWPPLLEMLGACGLDAALIDMEHVSYGLSEVEQMIVAAELASVTPLVRPPSIDPDMVTRILDAGAQGIVFPRVDDAGIARLAVECMHYAPKGRRGWGGAHTRRAMWQGGTAVSELQSEAQGDSQILSLDYIEKAESDCTTIFIIETVKGVENVEAILEVGGVDGVIFGWGDYSVEVRFDRARTEAAGSRVYEACKKHGVGLSFYLDQKNRNVFYSGCFYMAGVDSLIISGALRHRLDVARAESRT